VSAKANDMEEKKDSGIIIVRNSRRTFFEGVFFLIISAIVLAFVFYGDVSVFTYWWAQVIFLMLFMSGMLFMCFYYRWYVCIDGEDLIHCNMFGTKRVYKLAQVEYVELFQPIRGYPLLKVFHNQKQIFHMYTQCIGYEEFLAHLISREIELITTKQKRPK